MNLHLLRPTTIMFIIGYSGKSHSKRSLSHRKNDIRRLNSVQKKFGQKTIQHSSSHRGPSTDAVDETIIGIYLSKYTGVHLHRICCQS